ncbi:MAG: inorganic phosphate transporter [Planctomycetes bacterium]|nr:inorganic phosphate transporter [Planctomycetota bacterium]
MDIFQGAIAILLLLAVSDLVVGVANDAVNFLSPAIGSRAASFRVIMVVGGLGILAGVTFSSGMMEVARKGIFNPQYFTMPELMVAFLAVMLTDVILLDLYNTFGLPTSTTVSLVFELLGAAVAVSVIKIVQAGKSLAEMVAYINTSKALAIISGILLSVAIAFVVGAAVQFVTRVVFTFNFEKRVRRYGALWGGLAFAAIVHFILIEGAKGASFISNATVDWMHEHNWLILGWTFLACGLLLQLLMVLAKVNVLKVLVLVGTFAIAMAFAANDLVNFIGVPLASLSAYESAQESGDLLGQTMEALRQPVRSNTLYLLIAGAIMTATLWISRKARTVTRTTVTLGRQEEGYERFEATVLSQTIVRMVGTSFDLIRKLVPPAARAWIAHRFDRARYRPAPAADGTVPSFDLLRASVNLTVAAALISWGTSLKLPLSTTYVTFMVAMGTSLSDQAWGRESAVYRVTGVLTVVGGWFFTAVVAFAVSSVFAVVIYHGRVPGVIAIMLLASVLILRNRTLHRSREREVEAMEVFNLRKIKDSAAAINVSFRHAGIFLQEVRRTLADGFEGLFDQDLAKLREARRRQKSIQQWANIIIANIFKVLRLLQWEHVENSQRYAETMGTVQRIAESQRDVVMRAYMHVANNHAGLLETQVAELNLIKGAICDVLDATAAALMKREPPDDALFKEKTDRLNALILEFNQNQIMRIQDNSSKTRLSILFYAFMWNSRTIARQSVLLLQIFRDPLRSKVLV